MVVDNATLKNTSILPKHILTFCHNLNKNLVEQMSSYKKTKKQNPMTSLDPFLQYSQTRRPIYNLTPNTKDSNPMTSGQGGGATVPYNDMLEFFSFRLSHQYSG